MAEEGNHTQDAAFGIAALSLLDALIVTLLDRHQITEEELDANPGLVRSKNVKPPRGVGKIRLVCIGEDSKVDSQPCGGTHVGETAEVGEIHIGKIEKKGRENRRMRIRFGPPPQA